MPEKTPSMPAPKPAPAPVAAPVAATVEAPSPGITSRVKSCWRWTKIILLIVMLTVFVICVFQNLEIYSDIKFLLERWHWTHVPTAALVGASFAAGVLITLMFQLLRRGSRK